MRIRWLYKASQDLLAVENYISRDNPAAALETVIRILDAVSLLSGNPAMGRPGRIDTTRELIIPNTPFIVPYRVKNDVVEILRVFHQSRKWPAKI